MKKMMVTALGAALLATAALSPKAEASSMPKADEATMSGSIALGPSAGGDKFISDKISIGGSIAYPVSRTGFNFGITPAGYEGRVMYRILQEGDFSLNALVGAYGSVNPAAIGSSNFLNVEAGVAMAYKITPELTARVNIVPGINVLNFGGAFGLNNAAPSSGAEIAYKFSPTMEGTLGWNGNWDVLGLRFLM